MSILEFNCVGTHLHDVLVFNDNESVLPCHIETFKEIDFFLTMNGRNMTVTADMVLKKKQSPKPKKKHRMQML